MSNLVESKRLHTPALMLVEDRALLRELLGPSENHTYRPGRDMHGRCGNGMVRYENAKVECQREGDRPVQLLARGLERVGELSPENDERTIKGKEKTEKKKKEIMKMKEKNDQKEKTKGKRPA